MMDLSKMFFENLTFIITSVFLLIIFSYYILIFINPKKTKKEKKFSSITIIIPARNEEKYIGKAIESVLLADFNGKKQVIVVDDGSIDNTSKVVSRYKNVQLIRTKHKGKANSLNLALSKAKGELIAVVDGDSYIKKDALQEMSKELERKNVAAATGVVKVKNRDKLVCMWVHIEQIYNSLMRLLFSKLNANIVTPGPLSMYRKKELMELGGFSTKGFSEDMDITIRLIRKGYKIGYAENAISETNMPYDAKGFFRQRTRFARGMLNIFKRHLKFNRTIIDLYTLPILLFTYIQAIIMGSFTIYQISSGYLTYFISKGIYFDFSVLKFFFEWFSIIGFVKWTFNALTGIIPLDFITMIGIISTLLTYPLYLLAIIKFDKKFDLLHLIPIFFMFPFWLLIMFIYIISLPEMFRKRQYNIWKKNEP